MQEIIRQFPHLSDSQINKFEKIKDVYEYWNQRINVVSRKDIDLLYTRHVLHSLAIGKYFSFPATAKVLDVGTGGGFPGIPLSILFPNCRFHLVDSIGKKIKVVQAAIDSLELKNCTTEQIRAEQLKSKYHYIVSRAVAPLPEFYGWVKHRIDRKSEFSQKGILYLKGGDLTEELKPFGSKVREIEISEFYNDSFFETKKIVHLCM